MRLIHRLPRSYVYVFIAAFVVAFAFAAYTKHAWEDYYITFRASKNLASGNGLVFTHGERLHTFTSPLGVLLPALASLLTLNHSDAGALWIFRLMCIAAFAGAATVLYACMVHLHRSAAAAAIAATLLLLDAKSVDFTINGMETGILLLFVAVTLWAQFGNCSRRWLWLGLAWAGLMWTRPDGFIYIGFLAAGRWLFNNPAESGATRTQWLKTFALAGALCAAIYLPWFVGSWLYYGTPVPHTITAKSLVNGHDRSITGALNFMVQLPVQIWTSTDSSVPAAFLPSYYMVGGWPNILVTLAKIFATLAAFAWVVPRLVNSARAASFAFFGLHLYLSYFPFFPFPCYLPGTAILAFFVFASAIAQFLAAAAKRRAAAQNSSAALFQVLAVGAALLLVAFNGWTIPGVARQLAQQQKWIEDGNRRKIGEWLHQEAKPTDSVFLEPLGYVGYFSQLKMYDFPGLSSKEVTQGIRDLGGAWSELIDRLSPDWLVLRPREVEDIERQKPSLLTTYYTRRKVFDVSPEILALHVPGRGYLEVDSRFIVYHREPLPPYKSELGRGFSRYGGDPLSWGDRRLEMAHAPSRIFIKVPPGARHAVITYGMPDASYAADPKTDGATFEVRWWDGTRGKTLASRALDPARNEADRGLQVFRVDLPHSDTPAEIILNADSGVGTVKDWTCWEKPEFK